MNNISSYIQEQIKIGNIEIQYFTKKNEFLYISSSNKDILLDLEQKIISEKDIEINTFMFSFIDEKITKHKIYKNNDNIYILEFINIMPEEEEEMRLKIFLEAENGEIVWSSEDYQEYKILSSYKITLDEHQITLFKYVTNDDAFVLNEIPITFKKYLNENSIIKVYNNERFLFSCLAKELNEIKFEYSDVQKRENLTFIFLNKDIIVNDNIDI